MSTGTMAGVGGGALLVGLLAGLGGAWATAPAAAPPAAEPEAAVVDAAPSVDAAQQAEFSLVGGTGSELDGAASDAAGTEERIGAPLTRHSPIDGAPGVAAGVAEAVRVPQPPAGEPAQLSESARRLGKVFAAMRPADAAAVLQQLTDAEARDVLLAMPDRAAGAILTQFEPGRAASISSGLLRRGL